MLEIIVKFNVGVKSRQELFSAVVPVCRRTAHDATICRTQSRHDARETDMMHVDTSIEKLRFIVLLGKFKCKLLEAVALC